MLFFLTSISVVLIATGGAAALYGADTIRSESGATIAIAGVSVACAGFLLLGLVQVCFELRRVRRAMEAQNEASRTSPLPPLPPVPVAHEETPGVSGSAEPLSSARTDAAGVDAAAFGTASTVQGAAGIDRRPAPAEPDVTTSAELAVDSDLLDAVEDKAPEAGTPGGASAAPSKERGEPVATYTSGGNTYFMYGDGTIEADTPRGRFHFATMAELRHYAETGEGGILVQAADMPDASSDKTASRPDTITV